MKGYACSKNYWKNRIDAKTKEAGLPQKVAVRMTAPKRVWESKETTTLTMGLIRKNLNRSTMDGSFLKGGRFRTQWCRGTVWHSMRTTWRIKWQSWRTSTTFSIYISTREGHLCWRTQTCKTGTPTDRAQPTQSNYTIRVQVARQFLRWPLALTSVRVLLQTRLASRRFYQRVNQQRIWMIRIYVQRPRIIK